MLWGEVYNGWESVPRRGEGQESIDFCPANHRFRSPDAQPEQGFEGGFFTCGAWKLGSWSIFVRRPPHMVVWIRSGWGRCGFRSCLGKSGDHRYPRQFDSDSMRGGLRSERTGTVHPCDTGVVDERVTSLQQRF